MAIRSFGGGGGGAGGAGGIGGTVTPSIEALTDLGNICAVECTATVVDITGNHTFDVGTYGSAAEGYNGETVMSSIGGNTDVSADDAEHRLATASAVSVGGFVRKISGGTSYGITSATGNGSGNHNYSVLLHYSANNIQLQSGPAGAVYDSGVNCGPLGRWFHFAVCWAAGRTTAEIYLNGVNVDSASGLTAGDASGSADDLTLLGINQNGELTGYGRNFFVADSQLSANNIRLLAEESFGHALPTTWIY
jgi:hypothetical protein